MKTTPLLALCCAVLSACQTPSTTTVAGPGGTRRNVPTPQKFVKFQGSDFTIKTVTVKIPEAGEASVGELTFNTKFRDATNLAVILDNAQFQDAQMLVASASVLSDAQYSARIARISDNQQKLNQLALIASVQDAAALDKWISTYSTTGQVPVTDTTLGLSRY